MSHSTSPGELPLNRRDWFARSGLTAAGLALASGLTAPVSAAQPQEQAVLGNKPFPFRISLNTSTIRGQELGIEKEVEIAAQAGYDAIEPWMGDLDKFAQAGGSLKDLGKKIADLGLTVESAIGFAQWIVDDEEARRKGLENAKRDMETLQQIGGKRIAAPPIGAHQTAGPDLATIAVRYRALLELGRSMEILPQLEVWGFSKTLSRLGETLYVASEAQHPDACVLPDIYHLHKGGSDFAGLKLLAGAAIPCFHVNDYPDQPDLSKLNDADRVYPGDGVAPMREIFQVLVNNGFRGVLSLELFNREYWKQDPLQVAKTGLEKTRETVWKALA